MGKNHKHIHAFVCAEYLTNGKHFVSQIDLHQENASPTELYSPGDLWLVAALTQAGIKHIMPVGKAREERGRLLPSQPDQRNLTSSF